MTPIISCCCPTHGRAHLLPECVESFVRQGMGTEAELVLVNDCPEQTIECNVPMVRCINIPQPIQDASMKFHAAVNQCAGKYIAWWEDDDISLPFRLRYSMDIVTKLGLAYYKQNKAWECNFRRIKERKRNLYFGSSIFERRLWDVSGGSVVNDWADLSAHVRMSRQAGKAYGDDEPPPELTYFIYCWDGRSTHDSISGENGGSYNRHLAFRRGVLGDPRFRPGHHVIDPKWDIDYAKVVRVACGII